MAAPPPDRPEVVSIDLTTAPVLLRRLRTAGDQLAHAARAAAAAPPDLPVDPTTGPALVTGAETLLGAARTLDRVLRRIAELEGRPPAGTTLWRSHPDRAYLDPAAAVAAAERAARLLADGDRSGLLAVLRAHGGDPVFARVLWDRVGVSGLAPLLHEAAGTRSAAAWGPLGRLIAGFGDVLATASASGGRHTSWKVLEAGLLHELQGSRAGPAHLALLFTGTARAGGGFLLGATRSLVLRPNQAALRGEGVRRVGALAPGDTLHLGSRSADPRALVLEALARDPISANRLVRGHTDGVPNARLLLDWRVPYADGGRAAGAVAVAAATPQGWRPPPPGGGRRPTWPRAEAAAAALVAVVGDGAGLDDWHLAPVLASASADALAPHVPSLGARPSAAPAFPASRARLLVALGRIVDASPAGAAELRRTAGANLVRTVVAGAADDERPDPEALYRAGSALGLLAEATTRVQVDGAVRRDRVRDDARRWWDHVTTVVAATAGRIAAEGQTGAAARATAQGTKDRVGTWSGSIRDELLPATDHERAALWSWPEAEAEAFAAMRARADELGLVPDEVDHLAAGFAEQVLDGQISFEPRPGRGG